MADALPSKPPEVAIVVTGKALPDPRAEQIYQVERISREEIARSPSHQVEAVLRDVPGIQLFRRSDARSGHPTSQGITLRALGGNASSRALVLLDGVPQTDPFGGWINWPAFDPGALAEIRVVRGGGSVANGPGALAGTIEMTSRSDPGASGDASIGSRGALELRGRVGAPIAAGMLSLSAAAQRGDGFIPVTASSRGPADEAAAYRNLNGRARWVAQVGSDTEIQAGFSGFQDWRTRGTNFSANRTRGLDGSIRLVGRGRWQWSALAYGQSRDLMSSFASVGPGRASAARAALQYSVPSNGLGGSVELRPPLPEGTELRLGADARATRGESREYYFYSAGVPGRRRSAGGRTVTLGAFAEASADLGIVTLTGGARLDRWTVAAGHLTERDIASGATLTDVHYPGRSGWLPTARGGIRAELGPAISARSAAYLGWRMPTLNELFRPFRAGPDATAANASLDPERLSGIEAGLDYRSGPFTASVTAFANRLHDAIANVTLGQGPGIFPGVGFVGAGGTYRQRQNVRAVDVRGLEASAAFEREPWSFRAGVSLTHARIRATDEAAFLDGLRPAQTPNMAASLSAAWDRDGKTFSLALRHVGAQFEDDLNNLRLKPATTLDALAAWPIGQRLQVVARAENITNTLVMAGLDTDGTVERATPRTFWIGVNLR